MSNMRSELSERNKYWIPKNRYYELKYFCLQYEDYKRAYREAASYISVGGDGRGQREFSDPTSEAARRAEFYLRKTKLIEQAAIASDVDLASYILRAVTSGVTYTYLSTMLDIPCSRNTFYDRYHKFFYILNAIISSPIIE